MSKTSVPRTSRRWSALRPGDTRFYNLGIGRGYSVKEVIESAQRVTGIDFPVEYGPRRPGDPAFSLPTPRRFVAS